MDSPQMGTVDPIAQPDKLSYLPTELLDSIFNQGWTEKRPSGPINRALLPWYDRYFWKTVKVSSQADYAKFLDIVTRRPHVRAFCETLRVNLGPEVLTPTWLETVLPGLPNLVTLELNDLSSTAFDRLLSEQQPYLLPTCLCELTIYCTTGTRKDPYHPSHWKPALDRLPNLHQLVLELRSSATPTGRIKSDMTCSFASIEHLGVSLPQKGRSSVLTLFASLPSLKGIGMCSTSSVPDFAGAIAALVNPAILTALKLDADPKKGWPFPPEYAKLVNLNRLILAPLRKLDLGPGADFPLGFFLACLEAGRVPHLMSLHFDNVEATKGYSWHSDRFSWETQIAEIKQARSTWRRARYTKAFDQETLHAVRDYCLTNRVTLTGTVQTALEVDRELEEMEGEIEELRNNISDRGTGRNRGINEGREYYDADFSYGYGRRW